MLCYRIVKPGFAARALDGEGARLFGGRWNPPGQACVYTAGSRALAVLEMFVHLTGSSRSLSYRLLTIEVPDDSPERPASLLDSWATTPAGNCSQSVGGKWLESRQSTILEVPSVIIPEESNFLLNPLTPGFEAVKVVSERDFHLDPRLAEQP